jgi:hypothetical protein
VRTVPGQLVELDERAGIQQQVNALAGSQLAPRVLLFHGCRGPRVNGLVAAAFQVSDLSGGGVDVGRCLLSGRTRLLNGGRASHRAKE